MAGSHVRIGLGSVLLILHAGCTDGHAKSKDVPHLNYAVFVSGAGKSAEPVKGIEVVRIEIGSGVKYVQSTVTTTTDGTQTAATINDQPFEVGAGDIRIGPRRYGPLAVGDHVVIDADGVRINGTLSGPLP